MSTRQKGDELEDQFYDYLIEQQRLGELVFGAVEPCNCRIFRKKSYYCKLRERSVEFDVVVEAQLAGREKPYLYIIFECKNYTGNVPETALNDFTAKIHDIFPHCSKGVIVTNSRLQSGAHNIARNKGIGIVKYNQFGLEIVADRKGGIVDDRILKSQIESEEIPLRSLRFCGLYDSQFTSRVRDFIQTVLSSIDPSFPPSSQSANKALPFLTMSQIQDRATEALRESGYEDGPSNLEEICRRLDIAVKFNPETVVDKEGRRVLGSADFRNRTITINPHGNPRRERFTLAHELGHFLLDHQKFIAHEAIVEQDLIEDAEFSENSPIARMEYQANLCASNLTLPETQFRRFLSEVRYKLDIRDRGHGYIFVDEQPQNLRDFYILLSDVSDKFAVSNKSVEIRLKFLGLLNDQRLGYTKIP